MLLVIHWVFKQNPGASKSATLWFAPKSLNVITFDGTPEGELDKVEIFRELSNRSAKLQQMIHDTFLLLEPSLESTSSAADDLSPVHSQLLPAVTVSNTPLSPKLLKARQLERIYRAYINSSRKATPEPSFFQNAEAALHKQLTYGTGSRRTVFDLAATLAEVMLRSLPGLKKRSELALLSSGVLLRLNDYILSSQDGGHGTISLAEVIVARLRREITVEELSECFRRCSKEINSNLMNDGKAEISIPSDDA